MKTSVTLKLKYQDLTLTLPEGLAADPKLLDGGHPLYYCFKNPHQTENYLNCVTELLEELPQGLSVLELCGGIGLVARCVAPIIKPVHWHAVELDPACETIFLPTPGVEFILGDMYEPADYSSYGLVVCEFSDNTLPKMWRDKRKKQLLDHIVDGKPRFIYIADVGSYWCHLENHTKAYKEWFPDKPTPQNYHEYFAKYMKDVYGYTMIKHRRGGGASYFLMEKM